MHCRENPSIKGLSFTQNSFLSLHISSSSSSIELTGYVIREMPFLSVLLLYRRRFMGGEGRAVT